MSTTTGLVTNGYRVCRQFMSESRSPYSLLYPMHMICRFPIQHLLLVIVCGLSSMAMAGDIVDSVGNDEPEPTTENGGFLELGLVTRFRKDARIRERNERDDEIALNVGLDFSAGYRYERFFFEASRGGFDGLNLGLTIWQNDRWVIDFLAANIAGEISSDSDDTSEPVTEEERNTVLLERDTFYTAAGTRITRYLGNNTLAQFRLVADWYRDNGILGSLRIGQQWQLGNWSWNGFLGARFNSRKINQYWFGVSPDEATIRFPEFNARSAYLLEAELGTSYPVNRNLIFASRVRYRRYPGEITDSPLVDGNKDVIFTNSLNYVF